MRFWFDTEFYEDGETIRLISIGIAAEDGRTYYAESDGALMWASSSAWLLENVHPHLTGPRIKRAQMRDEVLAFMGEKPEIWAYYADYDWVALCQLFGRMIDLPKGWPMFCMDLKQAAAERGNPKLPEQTSTEHNALADALWTKEAWEWLRSYERDVLRRVRA